LHDEIFSSEEALDFTRTREVSSFMIWLASVLLPGDDTFSFSCVRSEGISELSSVERFPFDVPAVGFDWLSAFTLCSEGI
jgi:hypothetical protein